MLNYRDKKSLSKSKKLESLVEDISSDSDIPESPERSGKSDSRIVRKPAKTARD